MQTIKKIFLYIIAFFKSLFSLFKSNSKNKTAKNPPIATNQQATKSSTNQSLINTTNIDTTNNLISPNTSEQYLNDLIDDYLLNKKEINPHKVSLPIKNQIDTFKAEVAKPLIPLIKEPNFKQVLSTTIEDYLLKKPIKPSLNQPAKSKVINITPLNKTLSILEQTIKQNPKPSTLPLLPPRPIKILNNQQLASLKTVTTSNSITEPTFQLKEEVIHNEPTTPSSESKAIPIPPINESIPTSQSEEIPKPDSTTKPPKKEISESKIIAEPLIIPDHNEEITKLTKSIEEPNPNFDLITKKINNLLTKIDDYILLNESKMSKKQLANLEAQKNKLKKLKINMQTKKENQIQKAEDDLAATLEINTLKKLEIEFQNISFQDNEELKNILDPNYQKLTTMSPTEINKLESTMIKIRLQKILNLLTMPSILLFPFIKNRYFRIFSISLFINYHFNFIGRVLSREPIINPQNELQALHNGKEALNASLEKTYDNIMYLDILEKDILHKYPSLINDQQFLNQLNHLRTMLNNQYEKLIQESDTIDIRHTRLLNQIKTLKRYKKVS